MAHLPDFSMGLVLQNKEKSLLVLNYTPKEKSLGFMIWAIQVALLIVR